MFDDVANFIEIPPTHIAEVPTLWWDRVLDGRLYLLARSEFPFESDAFEFRSYAYRRATARGLRASVTIDKESGDIYLQAFPATGGPYQKWRRSEALLPPRIPNVQRRLGHPIPLAEQPRIRVPLIAPADENSGLQFTPSHLNAVKRQPPVTVPPAAVPVPRVAPKEEEDWDSYMGLPAEQALSHPDFALLREQCTCGSLNWHGEAHPLSCPLNPASNLKATDSQ